MAAKRPARKKAGESTVPVQEAPVKPEQAAETMSTPEVPAASGPVTAPAPVETPVVPDTPEIPRGSDPATLRGAAKTPDAAHNQKKNFEVVVFTLEREQFAIDLFDIKEVVEYSTITKLPNVPPYIRGIIDLRGEITTIIDLRKRLSLSAGGGEANENSRIIVLDSSVTRVKTGILVDDVTSVSTFETSQVDYASGAMNNEDTAILGIIKKKVRVADKETSELIIWLDIRKIIEDIEAA